MSVISFAVRTVFGAKDEQSKAFNKMSRNADRFGRRSKGAFGMANRSAQSFTKSILKASAIQKVFGLASQGAQAAAVSFLDFDQAITSASSKFKGLDLTTKEGQKTLEQLKTTARAVGRDTEHSAAQAGQGLDFLALAGFNAQQSMALLPGVANLATVANIELGEATDIASDSLGAFGLMTKDSTQLAINFTRVQDVMAKTTATSNTNLTDLFEAIQKGAPAFTAAGQSMETFNAMAGIMANSGLKGSESGTQLRNVMLRLAKPTGEAMAVLETLGVTTADASGNFRDVVDILGDFETGLKGMGTQQKSAALATVFGARSVTGINILLKEGTEQLRSYRQSLIDAQGASEKMAEIMRSSLMNRLKSLGSALLEVGFQFFDAFDEQGAGAITSFTEVVRQIDLTPFIEGIKTLARFGAKAFEFLEFASPFLKPFAATILVITAATKAWAIAQGILNAVMAVNPVPLIIIGVASLVAGIVLLVKNWDKVTAALKQAWFWFSKISGIAAITAVAGSVAGLFSGGSDQQQGGRQAGTRQPPNRVEVESRNRNEFSGQLNIAGAPDGSSFLPQKKNSNIDVNFLGLAPGMG